jgi:hypothetical protein
VCNISSKHSLLVFAGSDLVERGFGYPKASTQHSKTPKGLVAISQPSSFNFLVFPFTFSPFACLEWLIVVGEGVVRSPPTCEPGGS